MESYRHSSIRLPSVMVSKHRNYFIVTVLIFHEIYPPQKNFVALVPERTIPTERPLTLEDRGCSEVSATDHNGSILGFLDRSRYIFFQAALQLYSRG
jgi:hypothetical protein